MSCYEPPENVDPIDWLLTDCDNNLDSFTGGDPIAANQPPGPEPDFFDLHFGSGANNRSERSLADVANGITGSAGPVLPGDGRLSGSAGGGAGGFSGSVGAMLSEDGGGAPEYSLGSLAGAGGALDAADAWFKGGSYKSMIGNGGLSKAATYLNAANTFFTHDPILDGPVSSTVERTAMAGIDLGWGLAGGPWAVADAVTGSNFSGGMKMGAEFLLALGGGNDRSYNKLERGIESGTYGGAVESLYENSPFVLYDYGPTIAQQREMDRRNSE